MASYEAVELGESATTLHQSNVARPTSLTKQLLISIACGVATVCLVLVMASQPSSFVANTQLDAVTPTSTYTTCAEGSTCKFYLDFSFNGNSTVSSSDGTPKKGRTSPGTKCMVEITNVGGTESARIMKFVLREILDVSADGTTTSQAAQDDLLKLVQQHPVYFTQLEGGALGNIYYTSEEPSQVKQLKQQLISLFELHIMNDIESELLDGRDGPAMVHHSTKPAADGATVHTASYDYSHPACANTTSSDVVSATWLKGNSQRIHNKERIYRTKSATALVLASGQLKDIKGHSSLSFGQHDVEDATPAATEPKPDQKRDQIETLPSRAVFGGGLDVLIHLMDLAQMKEDEAVTAGELEQMLSSSFNAADSLRGYSAEDIKAAVKDALTAHNKSKSDSGMASKLTQLMADDRHAPEIAASIVLKHHPDTTQLTEFVEALGHAATGCIAKGACVAAQEQLMRLVKDGACRDGLCKTEAMTELHKAWAIVSEEDIAPTLAEFLGKPNGRRLLDFSGNGGEAMDAVCSNEKGKTWTYPTGQDPDWSISLNAKIAWDCHESFDVADDMTMSAEVSTSFFAYGHQFDLVGVKGSNEADANAKGAKNAYGSISLLANKHICAGDDDMNTCKSWNFGSKQGESKPQSTANNPPPSPPPEGATDCQTSYCNVHNTLADYVFLNPDDCGNTLNNPQPVGSESASLTSPPVNMWYGVVKVSGTISLTGEISASRGLEVDICTHLYDNPKSPSAAAYLTAGATGSSSITMAFEISAGVELIANAAVRAKMTIIEGSLSAFASVGGGKNREGLTSKGLANVDFNAAALSGEIELEVTLLTVFDFSWTLYAWDGRRMDEVELMSYNIHSGVDTVDTSVNFAKGDVPDYGICVPSSKKGSEMCQSSRCVKTPAKDTCTPQGATYAGQVNVPNRCSEYDMVDKCMPVEGYAVGKPCSSFPPEGSSDAMVNNCAGKSFCYAGPYHSTGCGTTIGAAQVIGDSIDWWKSCSNTGNPVSGKAETCPASALSRTTGFCAHNFCDRNNIIPGQIKYCCCSTPGDYYDKSKGKCLPCVGNGAYGNTCQVPLPKGAVIDSNMCRPADGSRCTGLYCRGHAAQGLCEDGDTNCVSVQCASKKCTTTITSRTVSGATYKSSCL